MLSKLQSANNIPVYSIHDASFKKYGKVIDFDATEIIAAANKIHMPDTGASYVPT